MTQAVLAVSAAPVAVAVPTGPGTEGGEPTIEELAALLPEPEAEPLEPIAAEPIEGEEPVVEPVAEPVVEPVAAPDVDAALERATKAAERARAGSRRYAETQRQLAEQNARVQQREREVAQLRQESQSARQREEALLKDPYKALKGLGMTDVQLAERAMHENSPESLVLQLKEQVEAERTARVALENRLETERHNAIMESRQRQAESEFVAAAKDADAYPELAGRKPAAQLWAAREALAQIQKNGHNTAHFSNAMIAEAANRWLTDWLGTDGKKQAAPVAPIAKPIAKTSGKTLTNAMAQSRVVAPATWDSLTEEQQLAHIAAGLPDPG